MPRLRLRESPQRTCGQNKNNQIRIDLAATAKGAESPGGSSPCGEALPLWEENGRSPKINSGRTKRALLRCQNREPASRGRCREMERLARLHREAERGDFAGRGRG